MTLKKMLEDIGTVKRTLSDHYGCVEDLFDFRSPQFTKDLDSTIHEEYSASDHRAKQVKETVQEMILNASLYGKGEVSCNAYLGDKGIVVQIADQGDGFDFERELAQRERRSIKPLNYEDLCAAVEQGGAGGNGLYHLLLLTDSFEFSPKGNEVTFLFYL